MQHCNSLVISLAVLETKSRCANFSFFHFCNNFWICMDHCAKWQQILVPVEVVVPSFSTSFPFSLSTIRDTTAPLCRRGHPQKTWAKGRGVGVTDYGCMVTKYVLRVQSKAYTFVVGCHFLPKTFGCVGLKPSMGVVHD